MLEVSAWDTLCLRFIPREFPLDPAQRRSAQRLLRKKAGVFTEFFINWLVPESLFGTAAGTGIYLLGLGLVISAVVVFLIGVFLWAHFAIHMRARAESHLREVLRGFGCVICHRCYYWLGRGTGDPRRCPECGAETDAA
jgi:hypothetical protein